MPDRRFLLLAAGMVAASAAAAPPPAEPARVPADAAVLVHVDVAALWGSPLGKAVRTARARQPEQLFADWHRVAGTPADAVRLATAYWPSLRADADWRSAGVLLQFNRGTDRLALNRGLKPYGDLVALGDGRLRWLIRGGPAVTADVSDPVRWGVAVGPAGDLPEADANGPLAPAVRAVAAGKALVIGINPAALPAAARRDDLPPPVRPFLPLLRAESVTCVGEVVPDGWRLGVRVRTADADQAPAAEAALLAGRDLLRTAILSERDRLAGPDSGPAAAALSQLAERIGAAKPTTDGTEASLGMTIPADWAVGPLLRAVFGPGATDAKLAAANLRRVGLAMMAYAGTHTTFPPPAVLDGRGKPLLSWRVLLLPYLGEDLLFQRFRPAEPWDSDHNKAVLLSAPMPAVFGTPGVSADGDTTTRVRAAVGPGAVLDPAGRVRPNDVADPANRLLVVTAADAVAWTKPDEVAFDPDQDPRPKLLYKDGGSPAVFADGTVRAVPESLPAAGVRKLLTSPGPATGSR